MIGTLLLAQAAETADRTASAMADANAIAAATNVVASTAMQVASTATLVASTTADPSFVGRLQATIVAPIVEHLPLFLVAVVGVLVVHIFAPDTAESATARPFLERWFEGRTERFYFRMNVALTVCVGAFVSVIYFAPNDPTKALVAGMGWSAAIAFLLGRAQQAEADQMTGAAAPPTLQAIDDGSGPTGAIPEPADLARDAVRGLADAGDDAHADDSTRRESGDA